jgi:hypothetical protein
MIEGGHQTAAVAIVIMTLHPACVVLENLQDEVTEGMHFNFDLNQCWLMRGR